MLMSFKGWLFKMDVGDWIGLIVKSAIIVSVAKMVYGGFFE